MAIRGARRSPPGRSATIASGLAPNRACASGPHGSHDVQGQGKHRSHSAAGSSGGYPSEMSLWKARTSERATSAAMSRCWRPCWPALLLVPERVAAAIPPSGSADGCLDEVESDPGRGLQRSSRPERLCSTSLDRRSSSLRGKTGARPQSRFVVLKGCTAPGHDLVRPDMVCLRSCDGWTAVRGQSTAPRHSEPLLANLAGAAAGAFAPSSLKMPAPLRLRVRGWRRGRDWGLNFSCGCRSICKESLSLRRCDRVRTLVRLFRAGCEMPLAEMEMRGPGPDL